MLFLAHPPLVGLAIVSLLLIAIGLGCRSRSRLPNVPWVGRDKKQWFSRWRARIRVTLKHRDAIHEAYEKGCQYSTYDRACILPTITKDIILLPPSAIDTIASQPDDVLSFGQATRNLLQTEQVLLEPRIGDMPTHQDTIRIDLTRQLGTLLPDILDELDASFEDMWGIDSDNWNEVCVYQTLIKIVARTSARVFVGNPLCRNDQILQDVIKFAQAWPITAAVLRTVPALLRPIFAPAICFVAYQRQRSFFRALIPAILERQRHKPKSDMVNVQDFLQWTIDRARDSGVPYESEPRTIAMRLLVMFFAAIHTSTFSITNAIFDLAAADESVIGSLRDEAQSALTSTKACWTKATMQLLVKHDSALRESSRLSSFVGAGLRRVVVSPAGFDCGGVHCPTGSWVSVPSNAIHLDPKNYDDAETYNPFRFSNMKDATAEDTTSARSEKLIKKANYSFVTTSTTFQAFGHGKHACPGRFFASNELKLLLSHMVMHYDIEHIDTRPPSTWKGEVMIPPMAATIRVKRKVQVT